MSEVGRELDEGGEAACYAGLVCPECGAVLDDHHPTTCRTGPENHPE